MPLLKPAHALIAASLAFLWLAVPAQADRLAVVASFSILGDFASRVGGDRIDLTVLVGPDSDPHVYEASPRDATVLAGAGVVLLNGLGFEGSLDRLVSASGTRAEIVELAEGAELIEGAEDSHNHDHDAGAVSNHDLPDPHAWQSVANAASYVENIIAAFCRRDEAGCPTYQENGAAYLKELAVLHEEIREAVAALPPERRNVVVTHNAFRYFGEAYGIRFFAPLGISTEAEASAADVAALIREIRERRAVAVFAENISDGRLIRQIAAEAGLQPGGTLYSDALSAPDGPAPTYIDMMRHNLAVLLEAIDRAK